MIVLGLFPSNSFSSHSFKSYASWSTSHGPLADWFLSYRKWIFGLADVFGDDAAQVDNRNAYRRRNYMSSYAIEEFWYPSWRSLPPSKPVSRRIKFVQPTSKLPPRVEANSTGLKHLASRWFVLFECGKRLLNNVAEARNHQPKRP